MIRLATQDVTQVRWPSDGEGARVSTRKPTALYHCNSCGSPDCSSSCWRSIQKRWRKPDPKVSAWEAFIAQGDAFMAAHPLLKTLCSLMAVGCFITVATVGAAMLSAAT